MWALMCPWPFSLPMLKGAQKWTSSKNDLENLSISCIGRVTNLKLVSWYKIKIKTSHLIWRHHDGPVYGDSCHLFCHIHWVWGTGPLIQCYDFFCQILLVWWFSSLLLHPFFCPHIPKHLISKICPQNVHTLPHEKCWANHLSPQTQRSSYFLWGITVPLSELPLLQATRRRRKHSLGQAENRKWVGSGPHLWQ